MQVLVLGKIDVYPPRGAYQIIVETLRDVGRGTLLEQLEIRKQKLASEGLFAQEKKKSLPPCPRHVAVITSPTGAAIQDILRVLARRMAAPQITVLPTLVQGEQAAGQIVSQIHRAAAYRLGDVMILARGGGSIEDLMPFNSEEVVRALADCSLPVISGVGHETDITLADLAADVRAATPSAAAELVSDRSEDLLIRSRGFVPQNQGVLRARLEALRQTVTSRSAPAMRHLLDSRLEHAMYRLDDVRHLMQIGTREHLQTARHRWDVAHRSLEEGSPQTILQRGFARIQKGEKNVCGLAELAEQDDITMIFADGHATGTVTQLYPNDIQGDI